MAQVVLDDSIENLAEFCALLAQTTADLRSNGTTLASLGDSIRSFEDTVEEAVGGFGDGVGEFVSTLARAHAGATDELRALTHAAHALADREIASWKTDVRSAGDATEDALGAAASDLDRGFARLTQDGFTVLANACAEAEAEARHLAEATEAGFADLAQTTREEERRFADLAEQEERRADETTHAVLVEEKDGLDSEAVLCASGWELELRQTLEQQGGELGPILQDAYGAFAQLSQAEGQDVIDTFARLTTGASDAARQPVGTELDATATGVEDDSMAGLETELERAEQVLATAEGMAPDLEAMVDELEVARCIVEEVDRLLNAMRA